MESAVLDKAKFVCQENIESASSKSESDWAGELQHSPGCGNYIVAKRRILEGEVICEELPLVTSPASPYFSLDPDETQLEDLSILICLNCYRKVTEFEKCKQCHWPICQNGVCEKASTHMSGECQILSSNNVLTSGSLLEYYGIEMLRYLLLRATDLEKWNKILQMESHINARRESKVASQLTYRLMEFARNCSLTDYSEDVIDHVIGVLAVNTYWSNSSLSSRYASLLYDRGSLFNHDCAPNTVRNILEKQILHKDELRDEIILQISAIRTIEEGEPITTSYISSEYAYEERQRILEDVFYFKCGCRRCLNEISDVRL